MPTIARRTFLKASLMTALGLLVPGLSRAAAPQAIAPGRLSLYNIHTGEKAIVSYRDSDGGCDPQALAELNRLLRCHYTNEQHPIDLRALDFLDLLSAGLADGREIHVISGYRSPRYNEQLINAGRRVAQKSLHLSGRALDVRIPGVELAELRQAAMNLRLGGVGFYPADNFVHLDSGPFRFW